MLCSVSSLLVACFFNACCAKAEFPALLRQVSEQVFTERKYGVSGFQKTGIFPFDLTKVRPTDSEEPESVETA